MSVSLTTLAIMNKCRLKANENISQTSNTSAVVLQRSVDEFYNTSRYAQLITVKYCPVPDVKRWVVGHCSL